MKKDFKIKIFLFIIWMLIVLGFFLLLEMFNLNISDIFSSITNFIESNKLFGAFVIIVLSVIRPLLFIPATLLTIVVGAVYGPIWGIIIMVIGENLSANLSFIIGKYFLSNFSEKKLSKKFKLFKNLKLKIRKETFLSVLLMRLTYFPFDMVGYVSGMFKAKHFEYALATFLGILPGITTFIFLGSATFNIKYLIIAFILFIFGFILSKYLKKKNYLNKF